MPRRFYAVTIGHLLDDEPDLEETLVVEAESMEEAQDHSQVNVRLADLHYRTGQMNLGVIRTRKAVRWVNAYSVEREYGGPEEGGWWYDWATCICSVPVVSYEQGELMKTMLVENLGWESRHDRYSVLGGSDFEARFEYDPAASEQKERPRYE